MVLPVKSLCVLSWYKRICDDFGVEPNIMQPLCLLLHRSDSIICICVYFKLTPITLQNSYHHLSLKAMSVWPINVVIKFWKKREKKKKNKRKSHRRSWMYTLAWWIHHCSQNEERRTMWAVFSQRNVIKRWPLSYKARIGENAIHWSRIYEIDRPFESKAKRS